jgi:hypothetical protein
MCIKLAIFNMAGRGAAEQWCTLASVLQELIQRQQDKAADEEVLLARKRHALISIDGKTVT